MDINESKIIYRDFIADDSMKKMYHKICDISEPKITKFENDNNLQIQLLFNKVNIQLALFHYLPDNYQIREKCDLFLEKLNDFLEQNLGLPQTT